MTHVLGAPFFNQPFSGTLTRGSTVRPFSVPRGGLRPYWEFSSNVNVLAYNLYSSLGQPTVYRRQFSTVEAATDRLRLSNLNWFTSYSDGFFNGFTAHVYVVTNGVRSKLTTAQVTATKVNNLVGPSSSGAMLTNNIVTDTRLEYALANLFRPSVGYWFRVAAINASGEIGTKSGWVQFTAPATITTQTATNTFTPLTYSATPSALAAPTNVAVAAKSGSDSVAEITWDAVSGATGYVVDMSYQDPTLNVVDEYLDLDTSGLEIPAGAVVHLEKLFLTQTDKWCSRVWAVNASVNLNKTFVIPFFPANFVAGTAPQWVAYSGGDPAPSGIDGEYFLRRAVTGAGTIAESFFHSGNQQFNEFREVLEVNRNYKVRFLMRAAAPTTVSLSVAAVTTGGSASFSVTTDWQWFEQTFSRDSTATGSTSWGWALSVSGAATIDFAAHETFAADLATWDYRTHIKPLASSGVFVRDHGLIKPKYTTNSMRQMLSRTGQNYTGATIYAQFKRCVENGQKPWFQVEWHIPPDDWLDLVAYICAPVASGHPMALLRQAQGQETPWIDVFPELILEFGNEAWQNGSLPEFWVTNNTQAVFIDTATSVALTSGQRYGAHCQGIIEHMKTSPYYNAFRFRPDGTKKTLFYGSGWAAVSQFETDTLSFAPDMEGTGYAGYNGGWESGEATAGEDGNSFTDTLARDALVAVRLERTDAISENRANTFAYESGPGYVFTGIGNANLTREQEIAQNVVLTSRAAGTATLATFCVRAAGGVSIDSFFILQASLAWPSHATEANGGGVYIPYGLMKILWDAVGRSTVRKITIAGAPTATRRTYPIVASGDVAGDVEIELIQAFEFKSASDPGNRVIVIVNRDIDVSLLETDDPLYSATPSGTYAVTVPTGLASCAGLSYYANVGNFRQHNRYPVGFRRNPDTGALDVADSLCVAFTYDWTTGSVPGSPGSIVIDDTYGASAGGLPAGNCVLLHLTGCVDA